ncbi:hypothetical protein GCM10027277_39340 [Pseudoduganella ginsengisoli]|uniref:DUF4214 domain-containing protein n=1 Tax=Pseudoduganella ginsengisoli TaxID=1462440 RepID=A0A6L6PXN4_9BURK|nr:DUF4214 domain-containing protein [Pseudoduganella ginsengisoli]MTW01996.1 DUF4214 domain-containing protein [Pseudoduganella ginsengisoli]
MAKIDVKVSQAVMDSAALDGLAHDDGALDAALDAMKAAVASLPGDSAKFTAATLVNNTVKITYPNGVVQEYTGVALDAAHGVASATGMKLTSPGAVAIETTGKFDFSFTTAPSFSVDATAAAMDTIKIHTLYATTSADYDPVYGNVSAELEGRLTVGADGQLHGTFSTLKVAADKFLTSATLEGRFNLSGNPDAEAHPDAMDGGAGRPDISLKPPVSDVTLDGKATSLDVEFRDGSYVRASGLGVMFNSGQLDDMLGLVHGALSGDDTIKVDLPAVLPHAVLIASGAGDDKISVAGGGGKLDVLAGAGNDTITILSGSHRVDGGVGTDTVVFSGTKSQYTVTQTGNQLTVVGDGGTDVLTNVERLQFSDASVAYDIDGNAGKAWRMYCAAFDRDPDKPGLGYWIKALDHDMTLRDLARNFINSDEFIKRYGEHSSNASFVAHLYNNVLHRDGEEAGLKYWIDVLDHGEDRANVLVNFSESHENQVQVVGKIDHGCDYTPWG